MGFKLFLMLFCVFQLASCATVDEEYQAYLKEYQHLTETVDEYKYIVTDNFYFIKLEWFIFVDMKTNTANEFLVDLQDTGSSVWGEAGLQCVSEYIPDVEKASEELHTYAAENLEAAQQMADSIAEECGNATAIAIEKHTSVELGWGMCKDDDISCKEEVVKSANEFIEEFIKNLTYLHNDAVVVFRDGVIATLESDLDTEISTYTRQFTNVIGLITQCWNDIA